MKTDFTLGITIRDFAHELFHIVSEYEKNGIITDQIKYVLEFINKYNNNEYIYKKDNSINNDIDEHDIHSNRNCHKINNSILKFKIDNYLDNDDSDNNYNYYNDYINDDEYDSDVYYSPINNYDDSDDTDSDDLVYKINNNKVNNSIIMHNNDMNYDDDLDDIKYYYSDKNDIELYCKEDYQLLKLHHDKSLYDYETIIDNKLIKIKKSEINIYDNHEETSIEKQLHNYVKEYYLL